jgi:hypothetical protein
MNINGHNLNANSETQLKAGKNEGDRRLLMVNMQTNKINKSLFFKFVLLNVV